MRFLVIGAGAIGGYFGGRLLAAGEDVTFLLRPRRVSQFEKSGLVIRSRLGNLNLRTPPSVRAEAIRSTFDVILVACKAYDLEETMASFAPAVGPDTMILPLLNGMRHVDALAARFGADRVLGGLCVISSVLDREGTIQHLNTLHTLAFGELDGSRSPRIEALEAALSRAAFDSRLSPEILQEMWEKWVFIAAAAGTNCLMQATIGDTVAAGGADLALALLDECAAIAAQNGHPPREAARAQARSILTEAGSGLTASLFKDLEKGGPTEAEQIIGDLLRRASGAQPALSLLRIVDLQLKAYECRRQRDGKTV